MKCFLTLIPLLSITIIAIANSAMPGVWQAGANGNFIPLFPGDSVYFGKIKMQREQIVINLYPGFAVVKGEYWMYNTTGQEIDMHVAYPKQGNYQAAIVQNVVPSYISALQVKVNDQPVTLMQPIDSSLEKLSGNVAINESNYSEKWFVWQVKFAPQNITKITVYFITDNSNSDVVKGHSHRKGDAFTYVLESGRAWGGTIDTGNIFIQLKGGLTEKDIMGVLPDSSVVAVGDEMLYAFTNKEPMPKDNLLLFYKDSPEKFNFRTTVLPNAANYFKEIDLFDVNGFDKANMQLSHKLDMVPSNSDFNFLDWLAIGALVVAVGIIALVIWLLLKVTRWASKK